MELEHLRRQIEDWIRLHREDAVNLTQQLVQAPSLIGQEQKVQELIAANLREMDLDVDMWEPDGEQLAKHAYFCAQRTDFTGSPNVVGVWKTQALQPGGHSLILNGHIDVVPVGDVSQWDDDPFSGKVDGNRLYGRGSTDMKGGIASSLMAVRCLKELGVKLAGDVIVQSVMEEESGGAGTLATLLRRYRADAAVIPEPTNLKIFPKQQGSMWFRIRVKGLSAHGGTRYEGVSAIEKSQTILNGIWELERLRNERITEPLYRDTPIPIPINVGKVQGGNWPSSVPDEVVIEGRMGVAPDEKPEDARAELERQIADMAANDEWMKDNPPGVEWFGAVWLPGQMDSGHSLLAALQQSCQQVLEVEPIVEASPWGTDGGLLEKVGGIPTVVFGPGVTGVAHFPNEYVEIDKVLQTASVLALTMVSYCGVVDEGGTNRGAASYGVVCTDGLLSGVERDKLENQEGPSNFLRKNCI